MDLQWRRWSICHAVAGIAEMMRLKGMTEGAFNNVANGSNNGDDDRRALLVDYFGR